MHQPVPRRAILLAGLLLPLAACESIPGVSRNQAVRQLLTLSTQRALARLGGAGVQSALPVALRSHGAAAAEGVAVAWPALRIGIRELSLLDADAVVEGGPTDATAALQAFMGESLFETIAPSVGQALGESDPARPGLNAEGLRLEVARATSDAIYAAIASEEAAIRQNPRDRAIVFGSRPALTRLGNGRGPL